MCVILSMYGGGFATVPAYIADIFGTQFVGAIHGRILTAWSTAGIIGPVVVNYVREAEIAAGVPRNLVYDVTLYILAGFLVCGLIATLLIRPLEAKWFMSQEELAGLQAKAEIEHAGDHNVGNGRFDLTTALAWAAVGLPLLAGAAVTLRSAAVLFR